MTEAEWMTCANPTPMWWFLEEKASLRKLRLVACGCCRRIWHLLDEERSRQCVEAAEDLADGLITEEEIRGLLDRFKDENRVLTVNDEYSLIRSLLTCHDAVRRAVPAFATGYFEFRGGLRTEESRRQTDIVRDIFGNPFHPVSPLPSEILRWNDSTVSRIAKGIYSDRAFARMPILHDALLDAGCNDEALLSHCRNPEGHVRGCWALDRILEKS